MIKDNFPDSDTNFELRSPSFPYEELVRALLALKDDTLHYAQLLTDGSYHFHPNFEHSAQNLIHYINLRKHDLCALQDQLAQLGIRALGFTEAHVYKSLTHVIDEVTQIAAASGEWNPSQCTQEWVNRSKSQSSYFIDYHKGKQLLQQHTQTLLGQPPEERDVRIMVTMPAEAASNGQIIHDMLAQGMNCMRINCAHDDQQTWAKMIEHLRNAEQALAKQCRIMMDLGGPKIRTCNIPAAATVLKIKPERDDLGHVIKPAQLLLSAHNPSNINTVGLDIAGVLQVEPHWLAQLTPGCSVSLVDARDSVRSMSMQQDDAGNWIAELSKTTYFVPSTLLYASTTTAAAITNSKQNLSAPNIVSTSIQGLPQRENFLLLKPGDELYIKNHLAQPQDNSIGCTLFAAFDHAKVGERVLFDDGKIEGIIKQRQAGQVTVTITRAKAKGAKLKNDKGINLPDTHLELNALTHKDRDDLAFVVEHADSVALSFVNKADDVTQLMDQIATLGNRRPGIVLKIETNSGFRNLPDILLTTMGWHSCGVMIARGDLAVECGFERLAEVQEEILWICEAAHVPVIWATQVLEQLAKDGLPSRSEISDVTLGHRAECIMLNKGPHILSAVAALDNIIRRMETHQVKQEAKLRQLHIAADFHRQRNLSEET